MKLNVSIKDLFSLYKIPIIVTIVAFILLIVVAFTAIPASQKYVTELIGSMIKQQTDAVLKDYKGAIELQQLEIDSLKKQKAIYDKNINDLKRKVGVLENEISDNAIPATDDEMRNRFRSLGYPPSN